METNERIGEKMDKEEYLKDNRVMLIETIDSLRNLEGLPTDEQIGIMVKLMEMKLIDATGNTTEEGRKCLYH
jgi:hypothetical protein